VESGIFGTPKNRYFRTSLSSACLYSKVTKSTSGDANALKTKFHKGGWEGEEQKGANSASEDTLRELADMNDQYDRKFGFIFLICATGKSALEMLNALQLRINNDAATEVCN
jgi:hypothetical protein